MKLDMHRLWLIQRVRVRVIQREEGPGRKLILILNMNLILIFLLNRQAIMDQALFEASDDATKTKRSERPQNRTGSQKWKGKGKGKGKGGRGILVQGGRGSRIAERPGTALGLRGAGGGAKTIPQTRRGCRDPMINFGLVTSELHHGIGNGHTNYRRKLPGKPTLSRNIPPATKLDAYHDPH